MRSVGKALWGGSGRLPVTRLVRSMAKKNKQRDFVVQPCEAARFCEEALVAAGADKNNAREVAHVIVAADYYGSASQGVLRLGSYIDDLCDGRVDGTARPAVVAETPAVALVEGCNALGACVANFCNQLAMKKARECGVGYVAARNTNHFGMAAYYTRGASDAGLIGVAMSVAPPSVVPPGAKQALMGTNPLSVAAPACCGDNFVFDCATSNTSLSVIEEMAAKKLKIPPDWALGKNGKPTTNAKEAAEAKLLLPLGGVSSGHKGFGLALAVDVLSSVLAGAVSGPLVPPVLTSKPPRGCKQRPACLGASFLCIDPAAFDDGFHERLSALLTALRCAEVVDASLPVCVPGDDARHHAAQCDARGGIAYASHQRNAMDAIVKRFKICPVRPI